MRPLAERQATEILDRFLVEGQGHARLPEVLTRLADDPRLFARYRTHLALEQALTGAAKDEPSVFTHERLERAILARVEMAAKPRTRFTLGAWGALVAAAAASLLLVVLAGPESGHRAPLAYDASLASISAHESLMARGKGASETASVGIRVFKVVDEGVRETERTPSDRLFLDEIVTFTYTSLDPSYGYLAIVGWQEGGSPIWYYPDAGERESIAVATDVIDRPLRDGFVLARRHRSGELHIAALFSRKPLRIEQFAALPGELSAERLVQELDETAGVIVHQIQLEIDQAAAREDRR